jgi:diacylglycerol kinase family enzyme
MSATDLCVIFNTAAGRRRAGRRLDALVSAWRSQATFWPTAGAGHAIELARRAACGGFRIVAAAGGDGTVHETVNGLLQAGCPEVDFAVIPIGSANDYAHSLESEFEGVSLPDAGHHAVDVGLVRDDRGRERFFVACLGLGLNGVISLESRKVRRLQGLALYGLATLRALYRHRGADEMSIAVDGRPPHAGPCLMLSALVGRREGRFVMAPGARLADGWLDYVRTGDMTRFEVLRFLPGLAFRGPPKEHPQVEIGRCRRIAVRSQAPLVVHTDGEIFCRPEDGVHSLEIELLAGRLRVRYPLEAPPAEVRCVRTP